MEIKTWSDSMKSFPSCCPINTSTPMAWDSFITGTCNDDSGYLESSNLSDCSEHLWSASVSPKYLRYTMGDADPAFSLSSVADSGKCKTVSNLPLRKKPHRLLSKVDWTFISDWKEPEEEDVLLKFQSKMLTVIPMQKLDDHETEDTFVLQQQLNRMRWNDDRIIGRKMGLDKVDILSELHTRNTSQLLSAILNYTDLPDLFRICQVNKTWKEICESNPRSQKRIETYQKQHRLRQKNKENYHCSKRPSRAERGLTRQKEPFGALQALGNLKRNEIEPVLPLLHKHKNKSEMFLEAAASLKNDEQLRKCPKCQHPAKVYPVRDLGACTNNQCLHEHCVHCSMDFHGSKPCDVVGNRRAKADVIGSKKSKRNLRRL